MRPRGLITEYQVVGEREDEGRGGIQRALILLDRATALRKVNSQALPPFTVSIDMRFQMGKFAEGLKDINESLQLLPTDHRSFLCRARIMVGLELFEAAAEDFMTALEYGEAMFSAKNKRKIEAELEDAEWRAKPETSIQQDHYATLGECWYRHSRIRQRVTCFLRFE